MQVFNIHPESGRLSISPYFSMEKTEELLVQRSMEKHDPKLGYVPKPKLREEKRVEKQHELFEEVKALFKKQSKWTNKFDLYLDREYMRMRRILFVWLEEVEESLVTNINRNKDILFLACEIFDTFMLFKKKMRTNKKIFQGYGITSLTLAIKVCGDNDFNMSLSEASGLTDETTTPNQVWDYQIDILKSLDFNIDLPTISDILERSSLSESEMKEVEKRAFERVLDGQILATSPFVLTQMLFNKDIVT